MKIGSWKIEREKPDIWKGLAAGAVAGLVGTVVMTQFQEFWSNASKAANDGGDAGNGSAGNGSAGKGEEKGKGRPKKGSGHDEVSATHQGGQKEQHESDEEESSTVKVAQIISTKVFDHTLNEPEKKIAGQGVHYAFGAAMGAIYGVENEVMPIARAGAGLPFGASVWLLMDEVGLTAMGLSKPPTEYPISIHAYSLSAHLVFGLTTELVRRMVRKAL